MSAPFTHDTLRAAQRAVMLEVAYVQKKTRVQGYTAAGETELIAALRPVMLKHGIVGPYPVGGDAPIVRDLEKGGGKSQRWVILRRTFRFTHVESGESADVVAYGEGADSLDKATLKAMTSGKKYALREFFCIETGDDPDRVRSEQEDDSAATFNRAFTAIAEADSPAKLDNMLQAVNTRELLTHEQRETLRRRADSRRAELTKGRRHG